jgi:hypothetical protein
LIYRKDGKVILDGLSKWKAMAYLPLLFVFYGAKVKSVFVIFKGFFCFDELAKYNSAIWYCFALGCASFLGLFSWFLDSFGRNFVS